MQSLFHIALVLSELKKVCFFHLTRIDFRTRKLFLIRSVIDVTRNLALCIIFHLQSLFLIVSSTIIKK